VRPFRGLTRPTMPHWLIDGRMAANAKVIAKEMCRWNAGRPADPNNYSDEAACLRREAASTSRRSGPWSMSRSYMAALLKRSKPRRPPEKPSACCTSKLRQYRIL
jgi:hypothetical protein